MSRVSSYLSWSVSPRVGSSSVQVLDELQSSSTSNEAFESAGYLLSKIGGVAKNFKVRSVFFEGVEAMEIYEPGYSAGVVILGVTLMDDEDMVGWGSDLKKAVYC